MNYYGDYDSAYAILGGGLVVIALLVLAIVVVGIVANWKLFKKAGKHGWECIVPFYSYWVLIEIAGLNWWWFLLIIADSFFEAFDIEGLSSIANLVSLFASFNCYYNIAKKFNKSNGTAVCAGIFSFIFILIFGFSKNEIYDNNVVVSNNGVFGDSNNNNYQNNGYQNNTEQATTSVDMSSVNTSDKSINNGQSTDTVEMSNNDTNNNFVRNSFCGNCGTKLENNVKFCPNCGKEIK